MIHRENEDGTLEILPETDAERELSPVEREMGARCFAGDAVFAIARRQFESATVRSRTITPVGSFTTLAITHSEADRSLLSPCGKSVQYTCDSAEWPYDIVFLVSGGFLSAIETYSVANEQRSANEIIASILGTDASVEFWDETSERVSDYD